MEEEDILAFVRTMFGDVDSVDRIGEWHGYEVYAPHFDSIPLIGRAFAALVKGDTVRWCTNEEAMPLACHFRSSKTEDD